MDASKDYLRKEGVLPKISFKETPKVKVKLINDKETFIQTPTGDKAGIKYLVEHEGEKKVIITGSVGLIQKLSQLEPGTEIEIEMQNRGGKNRFVVAKEGEDIPVINQDEYGSQQETPDEDGGF